MVLTLLPFGNFKFRFTKIGGSEGKRLDDLGTDNSLVHVAMTI